MLVFCDHRCINKEIVDACVVFNLSSLLEGFERVSILPPFKLDRYDRDFDIMYAEYIIQNDNVFYEFMKVMMAIYYGLDVVVLIDRMEVHEYVNESLIKFIQQRYGIIANNINELSDWENVEDCDFSLQGLFNMDQDKERFTTIHAKYNKID